MKVLFIDSEKKEIKEIEIEKGLKNLYKAIGCTNVDRTYIRDACCWFNDEAAEIDKTSFCIDGFGNIQGNAIIVGTDELGEDIDTPLSVDELKKLVFFPITEWLLTFLKEKNIDLDAPLENNQDVESVVEGIILSSRHDQDKIKSIIVDIDLKNQDVVHFFNHLANGIKGAA